MKAILLSIFSCITVCITCLSQTQAEIDAIDKRYLNSIELQPKCINISFNYPTGAASQTNAILTRFYFLEYELDGYGDEYSYWTTENRGPAIELVSRFEAANRWVTAEILVFAAAYKTCAYSAASSYWANAIWCLADGVLSSQEERDACVAREWEIYNQSIDNCLDTFLSRVIRTQKGAVASYDSAIEAYAGCDLLAGLRDLWETSFYDLPRKVKQ